MMEAKYLQSAGLTLLSLNESCGITGGSDKGWDYTVAGYIGTGVGYGVKKLWKAFLFLSANLYSMQSNPKLLYQ